MLYSNSDINTVLTNINEVYFGKIPELINAEKYLDAFRKKYLEQYKNKKLNDDPDLLKFNRIIEKLFGFGCFSICIINEDILNAYTVTLDSHVDHLDLNRNITATANTFKYNEKANYSVAICVFSGLILRPEFSTEEIMGVLMHEIGHNFFRVLDGESGIVADLYNISREMNAVSTIAANTKNKVDLYDRISNHIKSSRGWKKIHNWAQKASASASNIFATIGNVVNILTLGLYGLTKAGLVYLGSGWWQINGLPVAYRNERTADNFAAMYGYSAALTSALNKMETLDTTTTAKKKTIRIPILSSIYELNNTAVYVLMNSLDEHPITLDRCQDQIKLIEHELSKNNLDPKMRKLLQNDLKECNKQLTAIKDNIAKIDKSMEVRNIFIKALHDSTKSNNLKKLLQFDNKNKFDDYDTIYQGNIDKKS